MEQELPLATVAGSLALVQESDQRATGAGQTAYVETYGCQMNVADSELVARILSDSGYTLVEQPEEADVILLNTCAVREHAEERVIGRASQLSGLRRARPGLTLGILGCMAQRLGKELAHRAPFVNLVAGPDAYRRLPQLLEESSGNAMLDVRLDRGEHYHGISPVRRPQTNAWVTIIRGCDRFCTFCIVPFVRGRERCSPPEEVLRQVHDVAAQGFGEVTLLGQTVNSYRFGDTGFASLLRQVAAVDGIRRVRFVSPYPLDFDQATIDAMATVPQICAGLHLPVQSGSDSQLQRMARGYTIGQYRELVAQLRAAMPGISLTTDIITGFCGETEDDFQQTVAMMEEIRFDAAFMFKYSQREGTRAQKRLADDVPEPLKIARLEQIIALQERISKEINEAQLGQVVDVMVEGESKRSRSEDPRHYGRTEGGKVVVFPQPATPGELVRIQIRDATSHTLFGDLELSGSDQEE
jgi:tRNA-2-methylthio-N6-dimethylallyladenosine synthase